MQPDAIKAIANAVLYEGYMLYPYRPSALKNQRPGWSFGTLLPQAYVEGTPGDSAYLEAQMLLREAETADLSVEVRFLQLAGSTGAEALERSVSLIIPMNELLAGGSPKKSQFALANEESSINIAGALTIAAAVVGGSAMKLTLRVENDTAIPEPAATRDAALPYAMVAAHAILGINRGEFISLLDPPQTLQIKAKGCQQAGVFPVLVGDQGNRQNMLLSPIILEDYPQIAPESPGDFFDSSEIDELLTLRVLTLTDSEKNELRCAGNATLNLLNRSHSCSPQELLRMHGVIRERIAEEEQG